MAFARTAHSYMPFAELGKILSQKVRGWVKRCEEQDSRTAGQQDSRTAGDDEGTGEEVEKRRRKSPGRGREGRGEETKEKTGTQDEEQENPKEDEETMEDEGKTSKKRKRARLDKNEWAYQLCPALSFDDVIFKVKVSASCCRFDDGRPGGVGWQYLHDPTSTGCLPRSRGAELPSGSSGRDVLAGGQARREQERAGAGEGTQRFRSRACGGSGGSGGGFGRAREVAGNGQTGRGRGR
eukprot:765540-Hanusia_phi.AAC.1